MSRLEDFIKNNREDFDKYEPGPVVWHNVQQQLKKKPAEKGITVSMKTLRWSAAAAILLALGAWYFIANNKQANNNNNLADKKTKQAPASNNLPVPEETKKETIEIPANKEEVAEAPVKKETTPVETASKENDETNEELVHYARIIEIKQNQLKKIKTEEPLLYKQFAGDFNKLDSTFHILKKQLPVNPNREQILEAMIQNLQYQEALLNQQLNIIKKINNTKKEAYEKAYRSA
ncbi:MAG: hypothetical protein QM726_20855 [Chitinophagaceae bacterium]